MESENSCFCASLDLDVNISVAEDWYVMFPSVNKISFGRSVKIDESRNLVEDMERRPRIENR